MKKRLLSLIVSASMIACPAVSTAATGFSDMTEFHAWAEPQIEEMTTLGIIKGYTDGTFRPDRAITKAEALVLAARVAGYIAPGYSSFISPSLTQYVNYVSTFQTTYPNEAAYLMYKHILNEDEVASFLNDGRSSYPLSRTEMASLIVKLMRAEDTLRPISEISFSFADAVDIDPMYYPYVDYVTKNDIMKGVYDPEFPNDIFFKPNEPVTRAQMAVLLYRLLDKSDISVEYKTVIGCISEENTLTLTSGSGVQHYKVPETVNLVIDGYYSDSVKYIYPPTAKAAFFRINGVLKDIEIVNEEGHRFDGEFSDPGDIAPSGTLSGTLNKMTTASEGTSLDIDGQVYAVSSSASVYVDGAVSSLRDLVPGQSVSVKLSDGLIVLIEASGVLSSDPDARTVKGTIAAISINGRTISIDYKNPNTGEESVKKVNVRSGASIIRRSDGKTLDLYDLEEGQTIESTGVLRDGGFYVFKIVVY